MKILVVGKFYVEAFARHIAETLAHMGHEPICYEPGFKSNRLAGHIGQRIGQVGATLYAVTNNLPAIRAYRVRALTRLLKKHSFQAVIVCHDFLWPNEVALIKAKIPGKIALWFPDHLGTIGRGLFMNAQYDALFFKDPFIVERLSGVLSSPIFYLPECFNPRTHSMPEAELGDNPLYKCDIGTAGNAHAYRVAFFRHFEPYSVKIWGARPPLWLPLGNVKPMYQGRQVHEHEKVRAFRGAKIVLNNLHYGEIWGLNVRAFEAAGAGAFQLVDWRPGLQQLFTDGEELLSFSGIPDLKQKIDYWLPREQERRKVAEAGMRRAHREHTYRHRLEKLLATLAGQASGYPLPRVVMRNE